MTLAIFFASKLEMVWSKDVQDLDKKTLQKSIGKPN